jgi:Domain of unknown function (DUF4760)
VSPDWITAISSFATFVVIAASALAAVMQLRHMRSGNQIAVMNEVRHRMEDSEFVQTMRFIRHELPQRYGDAAFRKELLSSTSPESLRINEVANFFDLTGSFVKHRMVDPDLACDVWYVPIVPCWDALAPLISSRRAALGYRQWEDFEYFALLCKRFRKKHPSGTYPKGLEALPLPEPWPEAGNRRRPG